MGNNSGIYEIVNLSNGHKYIGSAVNIPNRWREHKYQLIDTGLKPGYSDIDTRMFHGIFNLMKDFCENEQPYHDWCWADDDKKDKKFKPSREATLASFAWQKGLVFTENEIFVMKINI